VTVSEEDVTMDLVIPFQQVISGRLMMDGSAAREFPPASAPRLTARPTNGPTTNAILSARFNLTVVEGEHRISFTNLPEGYAVQKATYGTTDLLKAPLKVARDVVPSEIVVELGKQTR
jgi:hypothetical protein